MKLYRAFVRYTDPEYYGSHGFLSTEIFANEKEALEWWQRQVECEKDKMSWNLHRYPEKEYHDHAVLCNKTLQKRLDTQILAGLVEIKLDKWF